MKKVFLSLFGAVVLLAGCSAPGPVSTGAPALESAPATHTPSPAASAEPADPIVITFYGSDIQVLGATYDDTPAVEDLGRVADGQQVVVPPGTGFSWGAVSWNGANDAGCRVTRGDEILLDNTAPNQMSAQCETKDGF